MKKNKTNKDWWENLTDEQKKKIEKGLEDIKANRVKTSEEVWKKYGRR